MIPSPTLPWQPEQWRALLRAACRDAGALLRHLQIDPHDLPIDVDPQFPVRVPAPFVARMRPGDPRDPLLLQVLAQAVETVPVAGYEHDPLDEAGARLAPGLLQKYAGRALLVVTQACAVHCRYCFRRHFDYAGERAAGHAPALAALRTRPDITEVILSGGDPLAIDDTALVRLLDALNAIGHVRRIRIHTRTPVVLPQRVSARLCAALAGSRARVAVVVHVNHARELDAEVGIALAALRASGATLLNQSVLLRGVNDSVEALASLSEQLFANGVIPYYLHLMDPVAGAAHFAVPDAHALTLQAQLQARLPGYLMPRLVREVPRQTSKIPLEQLHASTAHASTRSA